MYGGILTVEELARMASVSQAISMALGNAFNFGVAQWKFIIAYFFDEEAKQSLELILKEEESMHKIEETKSNKKIEQRKGLLEAELRLLATKHGLI